MGLWQFSEPYIMWSGSYAPFNYFHKMFGYFIAIINLGAYSLLNLGNTNFVLSPA